MKFIWFLTLFVLALCLASAALISYHFEPEGDGRNAFVEGYATSARAPLFTAFLTLGSFLLALKTSILQRLREGYDTKSHEEDYLYYRRNLERGRPMRYYQGLSDLSFALAAAMTSAILTSVLQVTLGFWKSPWSAAICVGSAAFSAVAVLTLTGVIFRAHKQWVDFIEKEKQLHIDQMLQEQRSPSGEGDVTRES